MGGGGLSGKDQGGGGWGSELMARERIRTLISEHINFFSFLVMKRVLAFAHLY